jgi:hypothetical protein
VPKYKFFGPMTVYVEVEIEADDIEEAQIKADDVVPQACVGENSIQGILALRGPYVHGSQRFVTTDCYHVLYPEE